jgi:transposase
VIVVSTFIGPGWLPEQLGSLYKAGSRKMTQTTTITAGIDVAKAKLDIAIHGQSECWQVPNSRPGWQRLAADLARAKVTRVGIEATGGYERGVIQYLRGKGFTVLLLQPVQVRAAAGSPL